MEKDWTKKRYLSKKVKMISLPALNQGKKGFLSENNLKDKSLPAEHINRKAVAEKTKRVYRSSHNLCWFRQKK